jgi:2-iminobutanoate/2-iminopropanoate deaminase
MNAEKMTTGKMTTGKSSWSSAKVAVVSLALLLCTQAGTQIGFAAERKVVKLGGTGNLPFSDGVIAGDTLYIAGQEGVDTDGKLASGGIGAESKAALTRIEAILRAAGFDLKDVVSVTVFLADINDFPAMNQAYKAVVPDPKPARATVQVAALVNNARIEISAIAVKRK